MSISLLFCYFETIIKIGCWNFHNFDINFLNQFQKFGSVVVVGNTKASKTPVWET